MAYYAPYQNQYYSQIGQAYNPAHVQPQAPTQNNQGALIWVQGIEAAKSYIIVPGSTVLLMDSESQRFYLKSSDASGMPLPLRVFEYSEVIQNSASKPTDPAEMDLSSYATKAEFEAFRNEIEGILKNVSKQTTDKKEDKENG